MKIQCDVCNKGDASVFCTADDAALCDGCDHRVHHANKLASKHKRFSLLHPSSEQFPVCDICQERRAFLFCQQDRAILCRECDLPIHTANKHTQKHNRFLLTGVKLSATSEIYTSSSPATANSDTTVTDPKPQPLIRKPVFAASPAILKNSASTDVNGSKGRGVLVANDGGGGGGCGSTSSISEYLIETLPGWHVEDFLDFSSYPSGFSKADNYMLMPFVDANPPETNLSSFSSENMGVWVPQAPTHHRHHNLVQQFSQTDGWHVVGVKETKESTNMKSQSTNRMWMEDAFTVPQIRPSSVGSKRPRSF